ncbi:myotubularin-related protein 14-like [Watersipora subatra]|uniref:myotubularin-related protein 14-like n=1 Tax=Watersipora subatra TaxID=2589382 RepID=UPI00355AF544
MAGSGKIKSADLHQLVHHMSKRAFRAKESHRLDEQITSHCLTLCGKDYKYSVLDNRKGELCNHYPTKLILLEYECRDNLARHESIYNMQSMTETFAKARLARCRTRFVMPVMLIEGKHICRSATISSGGEMYGRLGLDLMFSNGDSATNTSTADDGDSQVFDRVRGHDIRLLKELGVNHICDLMLENKKVKYFVNVTSSEKIDKRNRYSEFSVWSLPYPGCEFFKKWRDKGYDGDKSRFDWNQDFVDARLELPNEKHLRIPTVQWHEYKSWNLIQITQNYLHVILQHIQSGDSGLLIHCISGWDRTPLFISLTRLSLWADGLIHKSLSPLEILYFTVAYDWYLFGHNLPDRLEKGEEVLFFCFYFLKFIQHEDFVVSFRQRPARARNMSSTDLEMQCPLGVLLDSDFPPFGSSTSLCSENSAASRTDAAPLLFMVDSPDKDGSQTSSYVPTDPKTTPVSVPGARGKPATPTSVSSDKNSSGTKSDGSEAGSWQVVTGTGSFADSTSPYLLSDPNHKSSFASNDLARHSASSLPDLCEPSQRCRRLEEVRTLFYGAYAHTVGFKHSPESGGLSSLLDMVADKMVALGSKLA